MSATTIVMTVGILVLLYAVVGTWFVRRSMAGTQFVHQSGAILRVEGRDVTDEDMPLISECTEMFSADPTDPAILAALEQAGFEARYVSRGRA